MKNLIVFDDRLLCFVGACKTMTKTCIILALLVSVTASGFLCALPDRKIQGFYWVLALLSLASVVVLAFRAIMVTFITVLVLLRFSGYHRKVLIQQRWRITLDVTWCVGSAIFRSQKGLLALACATLLSIFATYQ
ncbi:unnamed protein product [Sphenostylis stenocarpa]|uniref:Uncharacterized protein n=1 Tax=Sphenostylis stenocarpa TaxID=92480 RepID=A0AA86VH69_9FABA|nr:unnamed protein product [Sphenostylis stenocarpa]